MAFRHEEDMAKRKTKDEGKVVFNEDSENIKKLSLEERKRIEETVWHMRDLNKYYPVEKGSPQSFKIGMEDFRKCEGVQIKGVKSNIPLVIDWCAMVIDFGFYELLNGKKTPDEVIKSLTSLFEKVKRWLSFVDNKKVEYTITIPQFNEWIDELIKWLESPHLRHSELVREILYCSCPMSLEEHVTMVVNGMVDAVKLANEINKNPERKAEISKEYIKKIACDTVKWYEKGVSNNGK